MLPLLSCRMGAEALLVAELRDSDVAVSHGQHILKPTGAAA